VIGVSTEQIAYNYLAASESQLQLKLTGGTDDGFVPSGGIESAVVTPDLLVKEMDVRGATGGLHPPPAAPKPTK